MRLTCDPNNAAAVSAYWKAATITWGLSALSKIAEVQKSGNDRTLCEDAFWRTSQAFKIALATPRLRKMDTVPYKCPSRPRGNLCAISQDSPNFDVH